MYFATILIASRIGIASKNMSRLRGNVALQNIIVPFSTSSVRPIHFNLCSRIFTRHLGLDIS